MKYLLLFCFVMLVAAGVIVSSPNLFASPLPAVSPKGDRPPRSDCQANLNACLETRLQSKRGNVAGESRGASCYWFCRAQDPPRWPDRLENRKDCKWWNY